MFLNKLFMPDIHGNNHELGALSSSLFSFSTMSPGGISSPPGLHHPLLPVNLASPGLCKSVLKMQLPEAVCPSPKAGCKLWHFSHQGAGPSPSLVSGWALWLLWNSAGWIDAMLFQRRRVRSSKHAASTCLSWDAHFQNPGAKNQGTVAKDNKRESKNTPKYILNAKGTEIGYTRLEQLLTIYTTSQRKPHRNKQYAIKPSYQGVGWKYVQWSLLPRLRLSLDEAACPIFSKEHTAHQSC